jgi:hypothetical protein
MQTELDKLLSSIKPEEVIVETFNRANEAINTFEIGIAVIDDWPEFKNFMAEFVRHIDYYCLRITGSINVSLDYYCPSWHLRPKWSKGSL